MKKIIVIIMVCIFMCGCGEKKTVSVQEIDCENLNELVSEGAVLIDVRSSFEYDINHLDEAINIDVQVIENVIEDEIPDKNTKIIVYCQSGSRSRSAADILILKGYTNVYDLGSIDNCGD